MHRLELTTPLLLVLCASCVDPGKGLSLPDAAAHSTRSSGPVDPSDGGGTGADEGGDDGGSSGTSAGSAPSTSTPLAKGCPATAPMDGEACTGSPTSSCDYADVSCDCVGGSGRQMRELAWQCTNEASTSTPAPGTDSMWSAAWDVMANRCALGGCHGSGAGNFTLDPADEETSRATAIAKAEQIMHQIDVGAMPPVQGDALTEAEVQAVTDWVEAL